MFNSKRKFTFRKTRSAKYRIAAIIEGDQNITTFNIAFEYDDYLHI